MLDLNLDLNSFEPEKVEINQDIPNAMPGFQNPNIDAEEQKRIIAREKEAELRKERINQKIKEEEEKRNEIRIKAAEFMAEFNQKRQEEIDIVVQDQNNAIICECKYTEKPFDESELLNLQASAPCIKRDNLYFWIFSRKGITSGVKKKIKNQDNFKVTTIKELFD